MDSLRLIFTILSIILTLYLPRKYSFIPLLIMPLYFTISQKYIVASLDFNVVRILYFFGWIRITLKNEYSTFKLNRLDKSMIIWLISSFISNNLLWKDFEHIITNCGFIYDVIGSYFFLRILIRDFDDIMRIIYFISIAIIPLSILMVIENIKGFEILSINSVTETIFRNGRIRAKGPFISPILAGTFGATTMSLVIYPLLILKNNKLLYINAFLACCIIVYSTTSSGPLLSLIFCFFCLLLWFFKKYINDLILISIIFLIIVAIIMKAPIWFLFMKISNLIGQGGGYHRSLLVNQFIKYYKEWFMFGTNYTAHWMPYTLAINPNMVDITNHYIAQAIHGGIITFILFLNLIIQSYKLLINSFKSLENSKNYLRILIWCSGVCLSTHLLSFLSVTYFDQIYIYWYLLLAIISTITNQEFSEITKISFKQRILYIKS